MNNKEIWVFAEHHLNLIHPVTNQLITKSKTIADDKKVVVVLLESNEQTLEKALKQYGPDEIIVVKNQAINEAPDSLIADLIAQIAKRRNPNSILFGATVLGRSVSARLQAKLQTGLTADCLDLSFEGDLLIQTKPSYGDNIMCEIICPNHLPQMATVRPNVFSAKIDLKTKPVVTEIKDLKFNKSNRIKVNEEKPLISKLESIATASRVIAIGRGMSDEKGIELVKELANKLGAKIGVTRPLTDTKPFGVEDQIGQSGNSIAPKLLITLGVHGAVQFTTGIVKSEVVIAINTNKEAPIFDYADYSFIGDAYSFVEKLNKAIQ